MANEKSKIDLSSIMEEFGGSGTRIFGGIIEEEYLSDLSGRQGVEKYDEMRRSDATVSSILQACTLPIRATKRFIQPSANADGVTEDIDREMQKFLENAIFKKMEITWEQFLQECLTFLCFGFSVFEKVYYVGDDGKFYIKKLAFRHQKTIQQWEMANKEKGIQQQLDVPVSDGINKGKNTVDIPWQKLLVFTINQEGENYQGISILRPAYKHRYIKSNLEKFDAIRHQKQGVGVPVLYLPKNASDTDKKAAKIIVEKFKTNEQSGIVMPGPKDSGWLFEFADLKAGDKTEMLESIKNHTREMTKAALAQFLELGATQSGSRALSEDQTDLFIDSIAAYAKIIENVLNRFLVKELIDLNFNTDRYPEIKFENLKGEDLVQLSSAMQSLVTANILSPDDELERFMREKLQLPAKVEETDPTKEEDPTAKIEDQKLDPNADPSVPDPKIEAHEHAHKEGDLGNCLDNEYFRDLCAMTNNRMILDIQNQVKDKKSFDQKKKGLKFNEYESESPRPMTFAERKVNFSLLKKSMDEYGAKLEKSAAAAFREIKKDLLDQVDIAIRNNDLASLGMIRARYGDKFSQELTDIQKEMFEIGKKTASAEMVVEVPPTSAEVRGAMRVQNDQIVKKMIGDLEHVAGSAAMQTIAKRGGSIVETGVTRVGQAVNAALDGQIAKAAGSIQTLGLTMAVNIGRASIFERYPEQVYALQYSAILDDRTTDRCLSLDGRIVASGSAAFYDYSPPQHYNCRSVRVEILQDETFKPDITGIPESIKPTLSIDNTPTMNRPVLRKGSPAINVLKQELQDRKEKLDLLVSKDENPYRQKQHKDRIDQIEKALKNKYSEYMKDILRADGIEFKE